MSPEAVDACMKLGAGHPMGPLALLDFVGLDVAIAIGESIGADVPDRVRELADAGRLGKKSGAGFYEYAAQAAFLRAGGRPPVRGSRLTGAARFAELACGTRIPAARSHTTSASPQPWAASSRDAVPRQLRLGQVVPASQVERLERARQRRAHLPLGRDQGLQRVALGVGEPGDPHTARPPSRGSFLPSRS